MSSYATVEDFENYVEGWQTDSEPALERLLERATRDVDSILGPIPIIRAGDYAGLKVDPATLADWEATALARAVCAQAEYRELIGETDWTAAGSRTTKRVKGPDFEEEYEGGAAATAAGGRIGPKVAAELAPIRHLRRLDAVLG